MPTVLRVDGFQVRIYYDDHEPAHVHVHGHGARCVVSLVDLTVRRGHDMKTNDLARALEIVEANRSFLQRAWNQIASESEE
jgi:hypothetical protein